MKSKILLASVLAFSFFCAGLARATDQFEIQVYDGEIDEPGKFGLETHLNTVIEGRTQPMYDVEVAPNHLTHLTFEPSYGVTDWWEAGAYLQFAYAGETPGGGQQFYFGGVKIRSKFVRPKKKDDPLHLGINFEISHVPDKFEDEEWASEIRPIIGYELGRWFFDVNPIIDFDLAGAEANGWPEFEPCAKIRYDVGGWGVGVEYYSGLGKINQIPSFGEEEHALFVAADLLDAPLEFNFGIGRGLTPAANTWVAKAIVGKVF